MKKYYLLILLLSAPFLAWGQSGANLFNSAINDFQTGLYSQSLSQFRQLLLEPQYKAYHGTAYFWIAKVLIVENRIVDAERNLEFFLSNFPTNASYAEGLYQRGRILYLGATYESAIIAFSDFTSQYPDSPFVPNAYYWTGEALFNLGQIDAAEKMFISVIEEFPTSYRVDAARYRLAIVNLSRREQELLKLLQWAQEDSVQSIEEFRRKELEYQEAITSYQASLANNISNETVNEEVNRLRKRIEVLETERNRLRQRSNEQIETIRRLENENRTLQNNAATARQPTTSAASKLITSSDPDFQRRLDLIAIKEESLSLKADLINQLEVLVQDSERRK